MLKCDANSYLTSAAASSPMLPSATLGNFTFADLANFAGVTKPL